jgi:integrase
MESQENHFKEYVEKKLEKIKGLNVNEKSKEIFFEFYEYKRTERLSYHRLSRIVDFFYHVLSKFNINFSSMTQKEANTVWNSIWENNEWKTWTKITYAKIWKAFVRWLNENFSLKIETKNWRVLKAKNEVLPESLISQEEFQKMFNQASDLQTKVILSILYEGGLRSGELLNLKKKDIEFLNNGIAKAHVRGKTGERVVFFVFSSGLLKEFLHSHPLNDPESPLFFYKNQEGKLAPLTYNALRMKIKRLAEKTGLRKKIHLHLFRHSSASRLVSILPEPLLRKYFGWSPSSKMPEVYLHLTNKQLEESLLKAYGLEVKNEDKTFIRCWNCGEISLSSARYCWKCKVSLDPKEAFIKSLSEEEMKKLEDWSDVLVEFFKRLEKANPQLWQILRDVLKEKDKEHLLTS